MIECVGCWVIAIVFIAGLYFLENNYGIGARRKPEGRLYVIDEFSVRHTVWYYLDGCTGKSGVLAVRPGSK